MALSVPQMNFILQIVILVVLFVSLGLKQNRKLVRHGITMLIAVALNAVSFFWIMWPSFLGFDLAVLNHPTKIIALMHGILGGIAEIFGIFLVAAWGLQRTIRSCMQRKFLMLITMVVWVIALVLGILLYAALYGLIKI